MRELCQLYGVQPFPPRERQWERWERSCPVPLTRPRRGFCFFLHFFTWDSEMCRTSMSKSFMRTNSTMKTNHREVFGVPMMRVAEAAALCGLHPNTLRYSIRKGRTRAVKVARTWYIPVADLEEQRALFNKDMGRNTPGSL
jgi:hypothetical protein